MDHNTFDYNTIVAIATVALVLITGYYAYITHRLLKENTAANAFQREAFERQLATALWPQLFCSIENVQGESFALTLSNAGDKPAFDVDLLLLAVFDAEEISPIAFADRYAETDYKVHVAKVKERLADGIFFCVYNHIVYPLCPGRRRVQVPLNQPEHSDSYYLLIQFRDSLGTNYNQIYWFLKEDNSERYVLGSLDPATLVAGSRIDYDVTDRPNLRPRNGQKILIKGFRDFSDMFSASVSAGWVPAFDIGVEDPGIWTEL